VPYGSSDSTRPLPRDRSSEQKFVETRALGIIRPAQASLDISERFEACLDQLKTRMSATRSGRNI